MIAREQVLRSQSVLTRLPLELQRIMERRGQKPATGSQASLELANSSCPQHIKTAHSLGLQRWFVACEHMVALERALTEPSLTYSPWTCARAVLENCSVVSWLFDVHIGHDARAMRSFNLRLQNIQSQLTFQRAEIQVQQNSFQYLQQRIEYLRAEASELGINEKVSRNGKFLGFGPGMPSHTRLIEIFGANQRVPWLGYPMLSAAAHGEDWAVGTLGSTTVFDESGAKRMPTMRTEFAMLLIIDSVRWLSHPAWDCFRLFGWDLGEIESVLGSAYDQAKIDDNLKFWKYP